MNYFCFFLKMRQKIHISASKFTQIIKKNAHALVYIIFLYYLCTGYEGEVSMKKYIVFLGVCLLSVGMQAMTIPQGSLYFDNSKTGYSTVKMVYGRDDVSETHVLDMSFDGQKWAVSIAQAVNDIYRFTFVGGDIQAGTYDQRFSDFKEYVSHTLNYNRTATSEAQMNAGDIFVPQTGDNWAQGAWQSLGYWESQQETTPGTASISGTLPVVYLNTTGNVAITSKEEYVTGSLYIDPLSTNYKALGSAEAPIAGQFKGRGNWTWTGFDKKPYRIKFDKKQAVLGMPSNKHWCLMAHADDCLGFLKNYAGYQLSEALGLKWTPKAVPVELVMNGEYYGLYFLTEQVRVGSNRVNVTEQEDYATDSVSGGWLVEIDNYEEEGNVTLFEQNAQEVWFTMKSPELLSASQRTYIESQLHSLNEAIWGNTDYPLWEMMDLDEAVKFYLVQELMEDCESYHGSCYLYKERDRNGMSEKWYFGPVWDFGNAYNRGWNTWIYDSPTFPQYWIGQLAIWPQFQARLREIWYMFRHNQQSDFLTAMDKLATLIKQGAKNDAAKWGGTLNYCDNSNMTAKHNEFVNKFNWRTEWLYQQWGEGTRPATYDVEQAASPLSDTSIKRIQDGQLVIIRNGKTYTASGTLIGDL